MSEANGHQIKTFIREYCKNHDDRLSIINHFEVQVLSFEELVPGRRVKSYASGRREITDSFMLFEVYDRENDIYYYPVFSESVGRKLLNKWGREIPKKMRLFVANNGTAVDHQIRKGKDAGVRRDVSELMRLIVFSRSMMIYHVDNPKPMYGVMREIYDRLCECSNAPVSPCDIKSINTTIKSYIENDYGNFDGYKNLQDFIVFLRNNFPERRLPNLDFVAIRDIMAVRYPEEHIYF